MTTVVVNNEYTTSKLDKNEFKIGKILYSYDYDFSQTTLGHKNINYIMIYMKKSSTWYRFAEISRNDILDLKDNAIATIFQFLKNKGILYFGKKSLDNIVINAKDIPKITIADDLYKSEKARKYCKNSNLGSNNLQNIDIEILENFKISINDLEYSVLPIDDYCLNETPDLAGYAVYKKINKSWQALGFVPINTIDTPKIKDILNTWNNLPLNLQHHVPIHLINEDLLDICVSEEKFYLAKRILGNYTTKIIDKNPTEQLSQEQLNNLESHACELKSGQIISILPIECKYNMNLSGYAVFQKTKNKWLQIGAVDADIKFNTVFSVLSKYQIKFNSNSIKIQGNVLPERSRARDKHITNSNLFENFMLHKYYKTPVFSYP